MTSVLIKREKFDYRDTDTQGRRPPEDRGRDWRGVFTTQRMARIAINQKKLDDAGEDSSLEALEEARP